ncbi:hypothetical protein H6P81_019384 [Aristolochia fimbriata]|uniref:DUF7876 domain-containing protein n=1 Tax=Aristolochia fimbriata TaxID=158543 RepID=A0AAV7DRP5_ARIFI|nr:hypothetical protein H6P81_019384 [Aristolochia fimbriata]
MLTTPASRAIICCHSNQDTKLLPYAAPCNVPCINFLIKTAFISYPRLPCNQRLHSPGISNNGIPKKWPICASSDDNEYRSSRNIAISLFRRYRNVVDRGGGDNLKEFISAGVNAYALGCTDEGLRKELMIMKDSGLEIEGMQNNGGNTSLKSKIIMEEVNECILWLSIIFITILCTPQPTIVRWSSVPPVSSKVMFQWKGFCAIIANAYFMRGMAWLPVKTLQLEQMAVIGTAEEPSVVASRMRLVFSTLEVVSPQWPKV